MASSFGSARSDTSRAAPTRRSATIASTHLPTTLPTQSERSVSLALTIALTLRPSISTVTTTPDSAMSGHLLFGPWREISEDASVGNLAISSADDSARLLSSRHAFSAPPRLDGSQLDPKQLGGFFVPETRYEIWK